MDNNEVRDPRNEGVGGLSGLQSVSAQTKSITSSDYGQYRGNMINSIPAWIYEGNRLPNISKFDRGITTREQLDDIYGSRADLQTGVGKFVNSVIGGATGAIFTAVEDISYLIDGAHDLISQGELDNERDNLIAQKMREIKGDIYNAMPIYEREKDTALGQFLTWNSLRGIVDSAIGFAIPGGAIAKGIGLVGKVALKGAKLATRAARTAKLATNLINAGSALASGALMNYAEGQMMAVELGENIENNYIDSHAKDYMIQATEKGIPLTIEEATYLAREDFNNDKDTQAAIGEQQANFVRQNRIFMLTDAFGIAGIAKGAQMATRNALLEPGLKATIKRLGKLSADNLLLQGGKEALEEMGQNMFQSEAEYQINKVANTLTPEEQEAPENNFKRYLKFATSKQAIVEGLMGFFSGGAQRVITQGVADAMSGDILGNKRMAELQQEYDKQQKFLKTISDQKLNTILNGKINSIEAQLDGDTTSAQAMEEVEAVKLIEQSFELGMAESMERTIQDQIKKSATPEEKVKSKHLLELFRDAESEYIRAQEQVNAHEIYDNRFRAIPINNWIINTKNQIQQDVDTLNTKLSTMENENPVHVTVEDVLSNKLNNIISDILKKNPSLEKSDEVQTLSRDYNQLKALQKESVKLDQEYAEITNPTYQKAWAIKENKRIQQEQYNNEVNYLNTQLDNTFSDKNNNQYKVIKNTVNSNTAPYILRQYDPETQGYTKPVLIDENGEERMVTKNDLNKYKVTVPKKNTTESKNVEKATVQSTEEASTPEIFKDASSTVTQNETVLEDKNIVAQTTTQNSTNTEITSTQTDDKIKPVNESVVETKEEQPVATTPIVSLSDVTTEKSYKRTAKSFFFGTKGKEVVNKQLTSDVSQRRWYDFLRNNDIEGYIGIVIPFTYEGALAGRFVLAKRAKNKSGYTFINSDGAAIGNKFNESTCIYSTIANPNTAYEDKIQDIDNGEIEKNEYLSTVWKALQNGQILICTDLTKSNGVVDTNISKVFRTGRNLVPIKTDLESDQNLLNRLQVTVATASQTAFTTKNKKTVTKYTHPGRTVLFDPQTSNIYEASAIIKSKETNNTISLLFSKYATQSQDGVSRSNITIDGIEFNIFEYLRNIIRYKSVTNLQTYDEKLEALKEDAYITQLSAFKFALGTKVYDLYTIDASGKKSLNMEFLSDLSDFLFAETAAGIKFEDETSAYYNVSNTKLNKDTSDTTFYEISYKENTAKNDLDFYTIKHSNYSEFVKARMVGTPIPINNPGIDVNRYILYEPTVESVEVTSIESVEREDAGKITDITKTQQQPIVAPSPLIQVENNTIPEQVPQKRTRFQSRINNTNINLDDVGPAKTRTLLTETDNKENLTKMKEWFTTKFPNIPFEIISKAIEDNVQGKLENAVVTIYEGAGIGTTYHEAFHVICKYILTPEERQKLFSEVDLNTKTILNLNNLSVEDKAEEILAEQFAEYMLAKDEALLDTVTKKTLFKKIVDYVTKLYKLIKDSFTGKDRTWTDSTESLFKYISENNFTIKEYFADNSTKYKKVDSAKIVQPRTIRNTNAVLTNDILNSVHFWFLRYFRNNGNILDMLDSSNGKTVQDALDYVFTIFNTMGMKYDTLIDESKTQKERIMYEQYVQYIQVAVDNWTGTNGVIETYLQTKLPKARLDIVRSVNDSNISEDISTSTEDDHNESTTSFAETIEYSHKANALTNIKLLLSTLPKKERIKDQYYPYLNSLGMNEAVSFGRIYNILTNKLSDMPANISLTELYTKLQNISLEVPELSGLIQIEQSGDKIIPSWLKLENIDSWSATDLLQMIQFIQTFAKTRTNFVINNIKPVGNGDQYISFDASIQTIKDQIYHEWASKLYKDILEHTTINTKGGILSNFYNINKGWTYNKEQFKKIFPNGITKANVELFLRVLGIDLSEVSTKKRNKFLSQAIVITKTNNILKQIDKLGSKYPVILQAQDLDIDSNVENSSLPNIESLDLFINFLQKEGIIDTEVSHISIEKKRVYDVNNPSYITKSVAKLQSLLDQYNSLESTEEKSNFLDTVVYSELPYLNPKEYSYGAHSLLMQRMFTNIPNPITDIKLSIIEGSISVKQNKRIPFRKLHPIDKLCTWLNNTMEGKIYLMRPADNKQERVYDIGQPLIPMGSSKKYIEDIFRNYLYDEIMQSQDPDLAWTHFDTNHNQGILLSAFGINLDSAKYLRNNNESAIDYTSRILNSISDDEFTILLNTWLQNIVEDVKSYLVKYGVILTKENNTSLVLGLNIDAKAKNGIISNQALNNWLRYAIINYAAGNIEQGKLFIGSPTYFKSLGDEFKRHNLYIGSKKQLSTSPEINELLHTFYPHQLDNSDQLSYNNKLIYRTAVFSDVITYSNSILGITEILDKENINYQHLKESVKSQYESSLALWKQGTTKPNFEEMLTKAIIKNANQLNLNSAAYTDMTEGDGFGIISLEAYRDMLLRSGNWNTNFEKLYQWEVQEYKNIPISDRTFFNSNTNETIPLHYMDWGSTVFHSLKPQHIGPLAVPGFKPSGYKLSLMPLLPSVLNATHATKLQLLNKMMLSNNISMVVNASANKGVTTKMNSYEEQSVKKPILSEPFNKFYNDDGSLTIDSNGIYHGAKPIVNDIELAELSLLTQDTYIDNWGIQVETGTKSHDKVLSGTQMMVQVLSDSFENGTISEKFGSKKEYVNNLVTEYTQLNNDRINLGFQQLKKELGITTNMVDGIEESSIDIEKIISVLNKEIKDKDLSNNFYNAVDRLRNSPNIDLSPIRNKLENILQGFVAKRVTSQKRTGLAAFQVPSTMWETSPTREYYDGKFNSSDLKFEIDQTIDHEGNISVKITSMEVYLPNKYKKLIGNNIKNVNPELLKTIGFRIPTQGLSSIQNLIIKDFLPPEAGDIVVLPSEIVAVAGSDYDIDKLYIYLPNTYRFQGEIKYIDFNNYKEQYEEARLHIVDNILQIILPEKLEDKVLYNTIGKVLEDSLYNTASVEDFIANFNKEVIKYSDPNFELYSEELLDELTKLYDLMDNSDFIQQQFSAYMSEIDFYKLAIENRLLEIQRELVALDANAVASLTPLNTNVLESITDMVMEVKFGKDYKINSEYYKSKLSLSTLTNPLSILNVSQNYILGKEGIGAFANAAKLAIYAQQYGFKIAPNNLNLVFAHNKDKKNNILLGNATTAKHKYSITALFNQWISAMADAAKNPFAANLGATSDSISVITLLTTAGVDPEIIALFIQQPIIQQYLQGISRLNSLVLSVNNDSSIVTDTTSKIFKNRTNIANALLNINNLKSVEKNKVYLQLQESNKIYSEKDLINLIKSPKDSTGDYNFDQKVLLYNFINYMQAARTVSDYLLASTYDTKDGGKDFITMLSRLNTTASLLDTTKEPFIINYNKLFNGGFITEYYNSISRIPNLFKQFTQLFSNDMWHNSKESDGLFDVLAYNYKNSNISQEDTISILEKARADLLTYMIFNVKDPLTDKSLAMEQSSLMMGNDTIPSLPKRFAMLRTKYNIKNNPIFRALVPIIRSEGNIDSIKPFYDKDTLTRNALIESFEELFQKNFNLATDLMKFCIVQCGLSSSPLSYLEIIPVNRFMDYMDRLSTEFNVKYSIGDTKNMAKFYNSFIPAFQAANYNDENIISSRYKTIPNMPLALLEGYTTDNLYYKTLNLVDTESDSNKIKRWFLMSARGWNFNNFGNANLQYSPYGLSNIENSIFSKMRNLLIAYYKINKTINNINTDTTNDIPSEIANEFNNIKEQIIPTIKEPIAQQSVASRQQNLKERGLENEKSCVIK